jgi:hypothetical protein
MLWSLVQASTNTTIKATTPVVTLTDCDKVLGLAKSVKMTPAQILQLQTAKCCGVLGVTCVGSRVDTIDWEGLNLNGTLITAGLVKVDCDHDGDDDNSSKDNPSSYLSQLSLTNFNIMNNNLVGHIPKLPATLKYVDFDHNAFNGPIPTLPAALLEGYFDNNHLKGSISSFPSQLINFFAVNNQLTGELPKFPSTLEIIDVQSNKLHGELPKLPAGLVELSLENNKFKGTLPATLPAGLAQLNLGTNSFSGVMPALPSGLDVLNVYNNKFSGNMPALPDNIRYINVYNNDFGGALIVNRPVQLIANVNKFTSVQIKDMSRLAACEISNNPIWKSTLTPAVADACHPYGLMSERPVALGKRSFEEIEKREVTGETSVMGKMLSMVAAIAALF